MIAFDYRVRQKVEAYTPILLVGLKADLCPDHRRVKINEAKRLVTAYNLTDYVEASSSNGENVEDIFGRMVDILTPEYGMVLFLNVFTNVKAQKLRNMLPRRMRPARCLAAVAATGRDSHNASLPQKVYIS